MERNLGHYPQYYATHSFNLPEKKFISGLRRYNQYIKNLYIDLVSNNLRTITTESKLYGKYLSKFT